MMQTVRDQETTRISLSSHGSSLSKSPVLTEQVRKVKIREFISWSVCFAIVAALTGLLKILKVGVTMDSVTSGLFYLSLAALAFFISKIISISKTPVQSENRTWHELN